ncbi:MAG: glycosyltransferase [Patescibacteria group bacterium]
MKKSFWKRYYYDYLKSFVSFLTPDGVRVLNIDPEQVAHNGDISFLDKKYEYIIASDVLGYVGDIQSFLRKTVECLTNDGRIVITQYNALWEPILRLASALGLRKVIIEQNWLSILDLKNFAYLAGYEVVKSGTKMIMPVYIPLLSWFFNKVLANIWPLSHLGLFHYIVARKPETRVIGIKPSISIIVPARNEAGTIEKIANELPELGSFTEIIFVEGNSTDNTFSEIQRVVDSKMAKIENGNISEKIFKYTKQEGKGKGDAVRKGFEMATGDILTIYDADMTVPADEVRKFYDAIVENKGDFINGSRLVYPLQKESMRVLNFFGNKFFSLAFSWILGQPLKDTLCGTKVLWRNDYDKIKKGRTFFGDFDPFGDFDLLFGAAKLSLKIVDLPVHYGERVYGTTNISRWKHGWLLLKMTVFAARKMKFV